MASAQSDEEAAATRIQAIHRGRIARRNLQQAGEQEQEPLAAAPPAGDVEPIPEGMRAEEEVAATRIQAIHRGRIARRNLQQQPQDATSAVAQVEADEEVPGTQAEEEAAAVRIQAIHRGRMARRNLQEAQSGPEPPAQADEEELAAIRIQAIHRGRMTRREMQERQGVITDVIHAGEARSEDHLPPPPSQAAAKSGLHELLEAYERAAKSAGRKTSYLVRKSLSEAAEAGAETFSIVAPGNHKLAFTSRVGDEDMVIFAQAFGRSVSNLVRLDLTCNLLTDEGATRLAQAFLGPAAQRLLSLSLRSNNIGPVGCDALCQALKQCPVLEKLDVSQNPLGRTGGLMLVELLQASRTILELNLADTESDIDVLVAIAAVLLTGVPKLKVCNMENPRIDSKQEDHTVHIGRMLRVNTGLREIYLGKMKFRDDGIRQLVSFLLENKMLKVLDLRCNEIGAKGAEHLGTLLASDCQLALLNLSSNRIGERGNVNGAKALAQALLSNRMLRALDLSNNSLCDQALLHIGEAVEKANSALETISLFHNEWDQSASVKFHSIFNDRSRILPLKADFVTSQVDQRIDVCKVWDFALK